MRTCFFKTLLGSVLLIMSLTGCGGSGVSTSGGSSGGSGDIGIVTGGAASLSWTAPATNSDGTPLNDLTGYRIYYGTSSGQYSNSVDVGTFTSSVISGLTVGETYYFVVTAYDTAGNESGYSNETVKFVES